MTDEERQILNPFLKLNECMVSDYAGFISKFCEESDSDLTDMVDEIIRESLDGLVLYAYEPTKELLVEQTVVIAGLSEIGRLQVRMESKLITGELKDSMVKNMTSHLVTNGNLLDDFGHFLMYNAMPAATICENICRFLDKASVIYNIYSSMKRMIKEVDNNEYVVVDPTYKFLCAMFLQGLGTIVSSRAGMQNGTETSEVVYYKPIITVFDDSTFEVDFREDDYKNVAGILELYGAK